MKKKKNPETFFPRIEGAPPPVTATIERRVRFHELDPMTVVWHGRYPEFFEEAQIAVAEKCGFSYPILRDMGIMTPIHTFHLEYKQPLFDGERFQVQASMIWSDAARINMEYIIRKENGSVASFGYTIQMFVDAATQEVLWFPPSFWEKCCERWRNGEFA